MIPVLTSRLSFTTTKSITTGASARFPLGYSGTAEVGPENQVVDLDGDGDADIVVGGKTGVHWLENLTINKIPPAVREKDWLLNSP